MPHFIEAASTPKAIEACIESQQLEKAEQLIRDCDDSSALRKYCEEIACCHVACGRLCDAERLYLEVRRVAHWCAGNAL